MNLVKVTYIGSQPDGTVQCPQTGESWPKPKPAVKKDDKIVESAKPPFFVRGVEFEMPDRLAIDMEYQDPKSWRVPESIQKIVAERRKAEKEAAAKEKA
jgi:hypothetical protein